MAGTHHGGKSQRVPRWWRGSAGIASAPVFRIISTIPHTIPRTRLVGDTSVRRQPRRDHLDSPVGRDLFRAAVWVGPSGRALAIRPPCPGSLASRRSSSGPSSSLYPLTIGRHRTPSTRYPGYWACRHLRSGRESRSWQSWTRSRPIAFAAPARGTQNRGRPRSDGLRGLRSIDCPRDVGGPESPLRWTSKSLVKLAAE